MKTGKSSIVALLVALFFVSATLQAEEKNGEKSGEGRDKIEYLMEQLEDMKDEMEQLKEQIEAQEERSKEQTKEEKKSREKKGSGKVILTGFANFNVQSHGGDTKVGFQLDRTYLGYEHSFNNGIKIRGVIDFGKPSATDDYNYLAYIKNAYISWTRKGLTISGGMISTTQFNMQEKFWGRRYIMKSYQDQYKFGASADLGISVAYNFADWVSGDFIVVNGEGYKKIESNRGLLYGLGFTFTPIENFKIRLYGGLNDSALDGESDRYNYAALVGYKNDKFTLAGEFNMLQNANNVSGQNLLGCSVYGSAKVHKLIDVYARYDYLTSNSNWASDDKSAVIAGFEIIPCKYVKISPNFRMDIPEHGGELKYMGYISCYFGL